jgi:hypothetical protein
MREQFFLLLFVLVLLATVVRVERCKGSFPEPSCNAFGEASLYVLQRRDDERREDRHGTSRSLERPVLREFDMSKGKTSANLQVARLSAASDLTERPIGYVAIWLPQVSVVECVESLEP